jgi:hypothetical protein
MKGMIYIKAEGIQEGPELAAWISKCQNFVATLPEK